MPPPVPPSVKAGRTMSGNSPISSAMARHSSSVVPMPEGGVLRPMRSMACLKSWRSSAARMAGREAPMRRTPRRSSAPESASETARLSAVWPPMVGSSASGRSAAMMRSTSGGVMGPM
uniref:CARB n=1 Tax=Arundo donax TaxID=35708 RepID=A0A0A9GDH6_ARUDO